MFRKYWNLMIVSLLILGDLVSYLLAIKFISTGMTPALQSHWSLGFAGTIGIFIALFGGYAPDGAVSRVDEAVHIARTLLILTIAAILFGAVFETPLPLEPRGFLKLALFFGGLSILYRWLLRSLQKILFHYNFGTRRTLIVGITQRAADISRHIRTQPKLGYDLIGFVDDGPSPGGLSLQPLVGHTRALPRLIRELGADEVIITLEEPKHESLLRLMSDINGAAIEVKVLPDMYEVVTGLARTEQVVGLPLIRINPDILTPYQKFAKRAVDVLIAAVGLLVTAPLLLVVGFIVRLTSPGRALFAQERVGYRGRHFMIHKIRTMMEDAEEVTGPVWAKANDPRITPIGRLLRRARLDELPQLWNVLIGEMSLVGPRPERPHFVERLNKEFPYYYRRLAIRPGITGWAQVKGNYDSSLEDIRRKLKDDFFYIENLSIRLDLKILLMTVRVVLSGKGH